MHLDAAQLSSLTTSVGDLSQRVRQLADGFEGAPREDLAADLFEVERHLEAAHRRLRTLLDRL